MFTTTATARNAVTTTATARNAVTTTAMARNAVTTTAMVRNTVTTTAMARNAVTTTAMTIWLATLKIAYLALVIPVAGRNVSTAVKAEAKITCATAAEAAAGY